MMGYNEFWGNNGMMGNYGWLGILLGIIFLLIVIVIIVFAFKALSAKPHNDQTNNRSNDSSNNRPLDILKERYAKGEITREEYEKMVEHLKK